MKRLTKRTILRRTAICSRAWRTSRCTNLRGFPRLHDAWEFEGPSSGDTRVFEPDRSEPINRFATGISSGRFVPATDLATMCGVAVELDDQTGLAVRIAGVRIGPHLVGRELCSARASVEPPRRSHSSASCRSETVKNVFSAPADFRIRFARTGRSSMPRDIQQY
jgi:hypothetical protein